MFDVQVLRHYARNRGLVRVDGTCCYNLRDALGAADYFARYIEGAEGYVVRVIETKRDRVVWLASEHHKAGWLQPSLSRYDLLKMCAIKSPMLYRAQRDVLSRAGIPPHHNRLPG